MKKRLHKVSGDDGNKPWIYARGYEIFANDLVYWQKRIDRIMFSLLLFQWMLAIVLALVNSPYSWNGQEKALHLHVKLAVGLGGLVNALPLLLIWLRPGWWGTRQAVAVSQMLWSGLLIHLTGGRIETHFHVFGSLAFLALYRDWRVLPTATVVVASDHLVRGLLWPESVYGTINPEWWRILEHVAWVAFEDIVLLFACVRSIAELRVISQREAELETLNSQIEKKVVARTLELHTSREQLRSLLETTRVVPWEMDPASWKFSYLGPQVKNIFGIDEKEWMENDFFAGHVSAADQERVRQVFMRNTEIGADFELEYIIRTPHATPIEVRNAVAFSHGADGKRKLRGFLFDVTRRKKMESDLRQAQKLESVGHLAAGVAHEINTPIQFVNDSVHFVKEAIQNLFVSVEKLARIDRASVSGPGSKQIHEVLDGLESEADWTYTVENVPKALDRALEGLERVAKIVRSMKEFAHPDNHAISPQDLNHALSNTLTMAKNEYRYVADAELESGDIPLVPCNIGAMNQVFLNLIVNAGNAIGEVVGDSGNRGKITVRTWVDGAHAVISISDTGTGIPASIQEKIFDTFFTTKSVGMGTGMGLSLARATVLQHGGTLTFESAPGKGTVFFIRLPLQASLAKATSLSEVST